MRTQSLDTIRDDLKDENEKKKGCDWTYWWPRLLVITILVVLLILAIVFREQVSQALQDMLSWVQDHKVLGPIILILVYIVCTVCLIPGSILTIGAGWAF